VESIISEAEGSIISFFHAVTFDIDILSFFTNKAISQKDIEET